MSKKIPKHVGLIVDGVRRWARLNRTNLTSAYTTAMRKLAEVVQYLLSVNVDIISIYLLSKQNLSRSSIELRSVYTAEILFLTDLMPKLIKLYNVRIIHVGYSNLLPERYLKELRKLTKMTTKNKGPRIYILAAYDPISELKQAAKKGPYGIRSALCVPGPLDLVVRTGATYRLSGFLPLQAAYAELFFVKKYWNDLQRSDLKKVLDDFARRERRFGL